MNCANILVAFPAVLAVSATAGLAATGNLPDRDRQPPGMGFTIPAEEAGTAPSPSTILQLERLSAEGNARAQLQLSRLYYFGLGVARNADISLALIRRAAESGNMWGQYELGASYFYGDGVERDYDEAMKWLRRAAGAGHMRARLARLGLSGWARRRARPARGALLDLRCRRQP